MIQNSAIMDAVVTIIVFMGVFLLIGYVRDHFRKKD